jgi:L-lactate utilization protein LutB
MAADTDRIDSIRQQIADLKKNWPAHSVPPALMQQLDDLEEALAEALTSTEKGKPDQVDTDIDA